MFALVAGTTRTAEIDGISAAGADPEAMVHTPAADAEILRYGRPVRSPVVPVSPTGCPTPAVVTRGVHELVGLDPVVVDGGLAAPTAAPTVGVGAEPGGDVRDPEPVPDAEGVWRSARDLGRSLPTDDLIVAETIPGGTTTALGVLMALGERAAVSSSLPENPLALKREVVADGLSASGLSAGDAAGDPLVAVGRMGDPVLATVAGLVSGAAEAGVDVTLAGGTQMVAAAALGRHADVTRPLTLSTTSFVAEDESAAVGRAAADLELDLTVTDPGFDRVDHPALAAYVAGEAKEGVGMGGALSVADRGDASMAAVRERTLAVYDRLAGNGPAVQG